MIRLRLNPDAAPEPDIYKAFAEAALLKQGQMREALTTTVNAATVPERYPARNGVGPFIDAYRDGRQGRSKGHHEAETVFEDEDSAESIEEATRRIAVKYEAMERSFVQVVGGKIPSTIVSGPPGMSKTYTMTRALKQSGRLRHDGITGVIDEDLTPRYDLISGGCTAPGLFHSFHNMRNGGLVILDDCDGVFGDIEALNLIKIATDSKKDRILSWRKRASWLAENNIPRMFEFKGHVAFLTNIDFERVIEKNNKDVEHFKALIDRARYICLTIRTLRDFMIRIRLSSLGEDGMLARCYNFTPAQSEELFDYVEEHKKRFYNLSMRLIEQIAEEMQLDPENWRINIEASKMRT